MLSQATVALPAASSGPFYKN